MAEVKYIMCDPYKRGIHVFIGSLDELKEWIVEEYKHPAEKVFRDYVVGVQSTSNVMGQFFYSETCGCGVVLIPKFPKTPA